MTTPDRPAEWLRPPGVRTDAAVLYLHGGGYVIGSPRSHRHLAAAIARAAGMPALAARLSPGARASVSRPRSTTPLAAYQWLLARGIAPTASCVAGDSAGGGLTVATLLALRDRRLPRPAGGVCISPWVDLTCSGASYATQGRRRSDRHPRGRRDDGAGLRRAAGDRKAPLVSPLYADLRDLPPLLIQVGSDEVLLDDALVLGVERWRPASTVQVEEWPTMIHVWHWFLPMLDEAERAIAGIGDFVRKRVA